MRIKEIRCVIFYIGILILHSLSCSWNGMKTSLPSNHSIEELGQSILEGNTTITLYTVNVSRG